MNINDQYTSSMRFGYNRNRRVMVDLFNISCFIYTFLQLNEKFDITLRPADGRIGQSRYKIPYFFRNKPYPVDYFHVRFLLRDHAMFTDLIPSRLELRFDERDDGPAVGQAVPKRG